VLISAETETQFPAPNQACGAIFFLEGALQRQMRHCDEQQLFDATLNHVRRMTGFFSKAS
jgi:hypothetical protein